VKLLCVLSCILFFQQTKILISTKFQYQGGVKVRRVMRDVITAESLHMLYAKNCHSVNLPKLLTRQNGHFLETRSGSTTAYMHTGSSTVGTCTVIT